MTTALRPVHRPRQLSVITNAANKHNKRNDISYRQRTETLRQLHHHRDMVAGIESRIALHSYDPGVTLAGRTY
ncbi:MAG: hypothetical protein MZV63_30215 [Marinilabiliales bacterium]|nr:hypothetical protein [Marinilabiliales bacterium]